MRLVERSQILINVKDPVVFEEGGGASSRLHPLHRPKFRALLD
ncbi:hypothetical protein [Streptomyces sp. NPDC001205]